MNEIETETVVEVLYGLRCANVLHPGYGRVYVQSRGLHQVRSLAKNPCYVLVVSRDGGDTWEVLP